jgi:outer membrane usher protein
MQRQRTSQTFPSRLRPASVVVLALFASASAWAAAPVPGALAEVQFNDAFLQGTASEPIDVSRFNKGNLASPGSYRADLYVNELWIGRTEIVLRQVGNDSRNVQPCFDQALLERIGVDLNKLSAQASARLADGKANACVLLPELIDDATATFDNGELRLDVSVPQIAMIRSARGYVDPKYWDEGVPAARLQYNANVYQSNSLGYASTQGYLGLNMGVNAGPWRFRHTGNLTYDSHNGSEYQSIQTNVQRSIVPLKSQLVIGDAFTDGTMFDSVGFRGVQLASDDRMYPDSQRGYAPTIHGIANSNARVQIRQNGNIIYETTVSAGAFEINDLYPTGYGGDLEVSVTEADGSVHVSKVPYAAAVNALRPGVTRYSVTAGEYRNPTVHDTPPLVQATVQHGFSNLLTGYGGLTFAQGYASAVAGLALNTDYGAIGLDVTHAKTQLPNQGDRSGRSVRLSYSKLVAPTNTNLTVAAYRYSTGGYLSLADAMALRDLDSSNSGDVMNGVPRGKAQVTLNQALPAGYGSFYLSGSTQDYWNRSGRDTQFQAGYNNSYKNVTYGVTASRQLNLDTGKWDNRVMLTVGIPLGKNPRAPYSTTSLQHDSSGASTMQETVTGTLGRDNAFSYGMNVTRNAGAPTGNATSGGGNVSYVSPMATLTANASKGHDYSQVGAGVSGGVVAYSGGVAFTPAMGETVAVVEAKDAAGARIANGAGLRVDPWGHAVVSNLTPFARNQIELDPKGLPVNVELKSTQQQTAPTAGAVVKVKFDTANNGRAAIIQATQSDGSPLPFGAEVVDAEGSAVGTVAQGGRIIANGLKSDSGVLTVRRGANAGNDCSLSYSLPKTEADAGRDYARADAQCIG